MWVATQDLPQALLRHLHGDGAAHPQHQTRKPALRFVVADHMPYNAAGGMFGTPGGKWIPLMKRTVCDESGA